MFFDFQLRYKMVFNWRGICCKLFIINTKKYNSEKTKLYIDSLNICNGNITKAAKICGISRRTFHRMINKYGIHKVVAPITINA